MSIYVSIVTYNHGPYVGKCIESVLDQEGLALGENLFVEVVDNASTDNTIAVLKEFENHSGIRTQQNNKNLGFCAAQNQILTNFLNSEYEYFLMLNPDVSLNKDCLQQMLQGISKDDSVGMLTPKLIRCDESLTKVNPAVIDAAGMCLRSSWRHFDRGSQELAENNYTESEYVFGGTGACLLISRECAESLLYESSDYESDLFKVHPELEEGSIGRKRLLDEAFFAFREDAELAFRANQLGWRCLYYPSAQALHRRMVLPSNRSEMSKFVNRLGVRNRFLLQLMHFKISQGFGPFFCGIILRNLLVLAAVLVKEPSSLPGLKDVYLLRRRALDLRAQINKKSQSTLKPTDWFSKQGVRVDGSH